MARLGAQLGAPIVLPASVAFHTDAIVGAPVSVTFQGFSAVPEELASVASTVAPPVQESVTFQVSTMSSAAAARPGANPTASSPRLPARRR